MEKKLGKITKATFGFGGYQDTEIGLHVTLKGEGWGVNSSICLWDITSTKRIRTGVVSDHMHKQLVNKIAKILKYAKVKSIHELEGIPVEVTFDNRMIQEWRVLTEVL